MLHKLRQASALGSKRVRRKAKPVQQAQPKKVATKKGVAKPKQRVKKITALSLAAMVDFMNNPVASRGSSFAVPQRLIELCRVLSLGLARYCVRPAVSLRNLVAADSSALN
jgi:hypothetical protein